MSIRIRILATGCLLSCCVVQEDAHCTPCPNMGQVTIGCTSAELLVPPGYMVRALGCSSDPSAQPLFGAMHQLTRRWTSIATWPLISPHGIGAPMRWPLALVREIMIRSASPATLQELPRSAEACRGGHFNASEVAGERAQDPA